MPTTLLFHVAANAVSTRRTHEWLSLRPECQLVMKSSRIARLFALLVVLSFVACLGSAVANAQYLEPKPDQSLASKSIAVQNILKSGSLSPAQQQQVDDYYKKYALLRWTNKSEGEKLARHRQEFLREMEVAQGAARQHVLKLALDTLTAMATNDKFRPAARYNAMLAIGEMNEVDVRGTTGKDTPYPAGLQRLLQAYKSQAMPDYVRVAAMVGIVRHAYLGIDPNLWQTQVFPLLKTTAETVDAPAGQDPAVHAWVRELAVRGLAAPGQPGAQNEVLDTLVALVEATDDNAREVRYAAARGLGRLDYSSVQNVSADQLVDAMGLAAIDILKKELEFIDLENLRKQSSTMGGEFGMGGDEYGDEYGGGEYGGGDYSGEDGMGMGGMMGGPLSASSVIQSSRRVLDGMGAIDAALNGASRDYTGIAGLATDQATKDKIDLINDEITAISGAFKDQRFKFMPSQQALIDQIEATKEQLEIILGVEEE